MTAQAVAFVSLFLGLVAGRQPVQVLVGERVAEVELRLDGELIGTLEGPPWTVTHDFGSEIVPHRLEATAYDAAHREVGRDRQHLNLPRAPAEASLVLDRDDRGIVARLTWWNVLGSEPIAMRATFDGQTLSVSRPTPEIPLPPHDPAVLHFLRVELDFPENVSSVVEATFGGTYTQGVDAQLTAVPIRLGKGVSTPRLADLAGSFSSAGTTLVVTAVEEGPEEITVVRDLAAQREIDELGGRWASLHVGRQVASLRFLVRLRSDQRLRFLYPTPRLRSRSVLFPRSAEFTRQDGGLWWLLTTIRPPGGSDRTQRLADAVAVAGMRAAGRNHRRAVVFLVDPRTPDRSQFTPGQVRRYLERLRVPLFVWSVGPSKLEIPAWGDATDISTFAKLERALKEVGRELARQRIVWVDGLHLPQEISLSGELESQGIGFVR